MRGSYGSLNNISRTSRIQGLVIIIITLIIALHKILPHIRLQRNNSTNFSDYADGGKKNY